MDGLWWHGRCQSNKNLGVGIALSRSDRLQRPSRGISQPHDGRYIWQRMITAIARKTSSLALGHNTRSMMEKRLPGPVYAPRVVSPGGWLETQSHMSRRRQLPVCCE